MGGRSRGGTSASPRSQILLKDVRSPRRRIHSAAGRASRDAVEVGGMRISKALPSGVRDGVWKAGRNRYGRRAIMRREVMFSQSASDLDDTISRSSALTLARML